MTDGWEDMVDCAAVETLCCAVQVSTWGAGVVVEWAAAHTMQLVWPRWTRGIAGREVALSCELLREEAATARMLLRR